jgi:hypothetical protein
MSAYDPKRALPSTFTSVYTAAMQTGGVGHYISGSGMISMISIHAPGNLQMRMVFAEYLRGRIMRFVHNRIASALDNGRLIGIHPLHPGSLRGDHRAAFHL